MAVSRNRGLSRSPHSFTNLCRTPSVAKPCRGPLCRVLYSSIGLSQGGFVARPPDSATSLVAKRPPGPVTSAMFLRRCHMYTYIYTYTSYISLSIYIYVHIHTYTIKLHGAFGYESLCLGSRTLLPGCFVPEPAARQCHVPAGPKAKIHLAVFGGPNVVYSL